jgi:hypothetical protein
MTLTLTQSNRSPWWLTKINSGEFFLCVIYKNALKSGMILSHPDVDQIEIPDICSPAPILQITFDKDYEV